MSAHIVSGTKMLKFSHKKISIFINPDTNNYTIYPNSSKQLKLALEGYCKSNQTHHCFDSQEVSLQYNEKTWSEFPSIEAKETIYINKGQIFSIVNSFKERKTTIIIKESNPIVIPIVNMNESSIEQLSDKLKVYLTFS